MRPPGPLDFALLFLLAFIWGSSFTLIKVVVPHLPPLSLTLWRVVLAAAIMLVSALMLAPLTAWWEGLVWPDMTAAALAAVRGVVHTALATLIMFVIIARVGATFFATINFLIPIIGYLLGVFALGEAVSWRALVALALVLGGIWLTARASRSRAARAAAHRG